MSAVTLILSAGCSKTDDIKSDEGTVRNVRELGSPVTNPTHSEWFKPEGTEPIEDPSGTACSGFICRNENGEVLLGRNFDGMEGPLVLIYNTANGYNYVQFTDPFHNSKRKICS